MNPIGFSISIRLGISAKFRVPENRILRTIIGTIQGYDTRIAASGDKGIMKNYSNRPGLMDRARGSDGRGVNSF